MNDFYKGSAASEAGYLKNKRSKRRVALRMTAMIDVIFLLLIFFVLTAKFREPEQFLDMALAEEKGNIDVSLAVVEPLVIKINGSRGEWLIIVGGQEEFAFSGKRLDDAMEKLGVVIENVLDKQKRRANDPVKIVCGDRVKWAVLARVYNLLYQTGMSDITFVIE